MSKLGRIKQLLIVLILLLILVVFYAKTVSAQELIVDPTAPLFAPAADDEGGSLLDIFGNPLDDLMSALRNYELASILVRGDDRIAVINQQRVREGDMVDDATVISIGKDTVTLKVDGENQVLEMYKTSIKTVAGGANNGKAAGQMTDPVNDK